MNLKSLRNLPKYTQQEMTLPKFEIRSSKSVATLLLELITATLLFSLQLRTLETSVVSEATGCMLCTQECAPGGHWVTMSTGWKHGSHTERGARGFQDQFCNCAVSCHLVFKTCGIRAKETKLALPQSWPRPKRTLMSASACERLGEKGAKGRVRGNVIWVITDADAFYDTSLKCYNDKSELFSETYVIFHPVSFQTDQQRGKSAAHVIYLNGQNNRRRKHMRSSYFNHSQILWVRFGVSRWGLSIKWSL